MKKEKLKRLKVELLATALCLALGGCNKTEEKQENANETAVFFIQGKAIIYEEGYDIVINSEYSSITDSVIKYNNITTFSAGVEAIIVKSMEDAIEIATAVVGEENIIYVDYKDEDMQLNYVKKLNN